MITVKADGNYTAVIAAFSAEKIGLRDLRVSPDGFTFRVRRKDLPKAVAILGHICYNYQITGSDESTFVKKLMMRFPLVVTALICAVIVFASDLFVWKIDVDGADESLSRRIESVVGEYGARIGGLKAGVDENGVRRAVYGLPDVAAVSVYYTGNTLNVDVLTSENSGLPVSGSERICSGYDCVITRIDAEKGTSIVSVGDVVRAGETLIVGETYSTADGSLLFTGEARGKVYGKVTFVYTCYSGASYVRTGRSERHTALGAFGHNTSLGESPFGLYETVTERHRLVFGVEVITVTYYELESTSADEETEKFISAQSEKLYELYGETFTARASIGADGSTVVYFTAEICVGGS